VNEIVALVAVTFPEDKLVGGDGTVITVIDADAADVPTLVVAVILTV
jgi:hypothetical protein